MHIRPLTGRAGLLAALALAAACGGRAPLRTTPTPAVPSLCQGAACADTLDLTFLGVGGFLIRSGEHSLLTAPSFTHPGLLHVFFGLGVRSDTTLVARRLALVDTLAIRRAQALLVGHGHYDHLLDVPTVARRWAPEATVFGGPTVRNILAPALDSARVVALRGEDLGTRYRVGRWIYLEGGRFRVMALSSEHAPTAGFFTWAPGRVRAPLRRLPRSAYGYKLGEPVAYLIDVVGPDSVPRLRIHFGDAAASAEHAKLPPFAPRDVRPVDVMIVTAGNFDAVDDYPTAHLRELRPRLVIVSHWEDFFRHPERPLRAIPLLRTRELAERLERDAPGRWVTPEPMSVIRIAY